MASFNYLPVYTFLDYFFSSKYISSLRIEFHNCRMHCLFMRVITGCFPLTRTGWIRQWNTTLLPLQGHECTLYLFVCVSKRLLFCAGWVRLLPAHSMPCALYNWWQKIKKNLKFRALKWNVIFLLDSTLYLVQNLYLLFVLFVYCMRKAMFIIQFGLWPISLFISNLYISGTHMFFIYIFLFSLFF